MQLCPFYMYTINKGQRINLRYSLNLLKTIRRIFYNLLKTFYKNKLTEMKINKFLCFGGKNISVLVVYNLGVGIKL